MQGLRPNAQLLKDATELLIVMNAVMEGLSQHPVVGRRHVKKERATRHSNSRSNAGVGLQDLIGPLREAV